MDAQLVPLPLPSHLRGDPAWRAVWHLLSQTFPSCEDVWRYVDANGGAIDFEGMLAGRSWSGGESCLLLIAWSLFNGERSVNLWEVCSRLDSRRLAIVLDAIREGWLQTDED